MLAIPIRVLVLNRRAAERDHSLLWAIQSHKHFYKRRFAAPISADDKHQLAGREGQIDRTERKRFASALIRSVGKDHLLEADCTRLQSLYGGTRISGIHGVVQS